MCTMGSTRWRVVSVQTPARCRSRSITCWAWGWTSCLTSNAGVNDSYLRDALNSILAVTSASGAILDRVTDDPYGNSSDSNGSYAPAFKFTGPKPDTVPDAEPNS